MTEAVTAFFVSLVPAAVGAWPIYRALLSLKVRQTVSEHVAEHAHKQGTPTMGGIIILAGLLPFLAWFAAEYAGAAAGLFALTVGYGLIGFVDDFVVPRVMKGKRGLGWTQKLLMQIGFACLAGLLMHPANTPALLFGVFCILFFSNAFNFTDGLDWLASTVLIALSLGAIGIAFTVGAPSIAVILIGLIAATLPFMVLNRPPAKIFMGDVGSMPIGGVLGLLAAALAWPAVAPGLNATDDLSPRSTMVWIALAILSLGMVAELVPVPLQIASVKLRKKRLFPRTPIHHAFQLAGWKETRVVALFFGCQVAFSLIAYAIAVTAR